MGARSVGVCGDRRRVTDLVTYLVTYLVSYLVTDGDVLLAAPCLPRSEGWR